MTATAVPILTQRYGAGAVPNQLHEPMAAAVKTLNGTIVCLEAGYATPARSALGLTAIGVSYGTFDNTSGAAAAIECVVDQGVFPFKNSASADEITQAHAGLDCYIVDNQTVALTNGAGTRSFAGRIVWVDAAGVWVEMGLHVRPDATTPGLFNSAVRTVRGVCYANMSISAFVGVTGGTAQDGITYVAGDRVLLANQTTAAENGVYVVGTVADGTAPLTRAPDMPTGAAYVNGCIVEVSEGTLFRGSSWKAMGTGALIVGTHDPVFYPRNCRGTLTLTAGTKTLGATEGLYLYSTTRSSINVTRNTPAGTLTGTTGYQCAASGRTAGKSGTAAATIIAHVEAGTIQNQDTSTLDWLVTNW